jgi:hypothetical protein
MKKERSMRFEQYFRNLFREHLTKLHYRQPSNVVKDHIMNDPFVMFFGGRDWENFEADINNILEQHRAHFILGLFMIVISDQNLYRYHQNDYVIWREKTLFPKFGWSGFGPHNENPLKILSVPSQNGYLNSEEDIELINDFANFFWDEVGDMVKRYELNVSQIEFFETMLKDVDFANDSCLATNQIRKTLVGRM